MRTFGNILLQFANSVDILEEENFKKIQVYIESYLRTILHIRFVRLMLIRETVGGEVMLVKYSLNTGLEDILMLKDTTGNYNGQMPYAFAKNKRLWVTSIDKEESLNDCSKYVDHWSEDEAFPCYKTINSNVEIKTSIIIPIRRDNKIDNNNHILGVVNFESEEYLLPNRQAQYELKNISFTLGKLFQLYENRSFLRANTNAVIAILGRDLIDFKEEHKGYFFARRPKIFFAFSSKADGAVVGGVKELIINSFSEKLNLIHWDNNENLGSITPQLLENMSSSEYLVCYLSEKEQEELTYHDNPNVLIELGYFIGKHTHLINHKNILIIREEKSEKNIPFDIKDIGILNVARFIEGEKLNRNTFIDDLTVKINRFLSYEIN